MNAYSFGAIAGALIATFLVSRLLLWATKRWTGAGRLVLVHVVTAAAACTLAAFGNANGGPLNWNASVFYVGASVVWLVVDLVRQRRQAPAV